MTSSAMARCRLMPHALLASFVLVSVVIAALAVASVAGAATFVVSSTVDSVDVAPGDGVCADSLGLCTLRAAIQEANAFPGAHTILLGAGTFQLALAGRNEDLGATGDLDVHSSLAIVGLGSEATTIDANGIDRVLDVHPDAGAVELKGLTVTGGRWVRVTPPDVDDRVEGGGILNSATLSLVDVLVTGNAAFPGSVSDGQGGGIMNRGVGDAPAVLSLLRSTVSENTAAIEGGGIWNNGSAGLVDSTISGNFARSDGGGIANVAGTLVVRRSTITSNDTVNQAGGISNSGALSLLDSSVTKNQTTFFGGGLASAGTVTIERSTLSQNSTSTGASGFGGSAIVTGGKLSLLNSTVSDNSAQSGSAIRAESGAITVSYSTIAGNTGGGLAVEPGTHATIGGTLLAENSSGFGAANCNGSVTPTSLGHNLEDESSCALAGPGDLSGIDPLLGPLADNGGPTLTRGLLPGSPAIDAAADPVCPATDQRGVSRPQGPACDIGAYEVVRSAPCLTGTQKGPLTVSQGETVCIGAGGVQSGPVRVNPGGSLEVEGGAINGPLTATGAAAVRICAATLRGPVAISGSSGPVVIGGEACEANTIVGPLRVTDSTGGVEVNGNHVNGPLRVTGNSAPVRAVGNTVTGPVTIQP